MTRWRSPDADSTPGQAAPAPSAGWRYGCWAVLQLGALALLGYAAWQRIRLRGSVAGIFAGNRLQLFKP